MAPSEDTNTPDQRQPDASAWDLKDVDEGLAKTPAESSELQPAQPAAADAAGAAAPGPADEQPRDEVGDHAPSFASQPTPLPVGAPAKKSRKKLLIVLGVILALLLAGAGTVFALYNNPDKVLGDALSKVLLAENLSGKGGLRVSDDDGSATIGFDFQGNDQTGYTLNADIKSRINDTPFEMTAAFIASKEGDVYFKVSNVRDALQNLEGLVESGRFDTVIALVDNKWIKVPAEDLERDKDRANIQECVAKIDQEIKRNGSLSTEVRDAYRANPFFVIDSTLKPESVNGVDSLHYKLRIDTAALRTFITDAKQTELYKKIQACDKEFELDENDIAESLKDSGKADIQVWIGRWSHEFTRVKVAGSGEDKMTYDLTLEPRFNQPVNVTVPAEATPFKTVQQEFMRALGFDETMVLGSRTFNPRSALR